jgi:hypothetical protein
MAVIAGPRPVRLTGLSSPQSGHQRRPGSVQAHTELISPHGVPSESSNPIGSSYRALKTNVFILSALQRGSEEPPARRGQRRCYRVRRERTNHGLGACPQHVPSGILLGVDGECKSLILRFPAWRHWQTPWIPVPVGNTVPVQVLSQAPPQYTRATRLHSLQPP